jgi:multidrug resistance efflux pump
MRKSLLAILMIGAVIMYTGCSKSAANVEAEAAPVPEQERAVEAFGIIEALEIENICLDIGAEVERVSVKEGQQVKKGDVLLSLNMNDYMERIWSKQHELSIIRLEAQNLDIDSINPEIEKLGNDLSFANEQLQKASEELEAQEKLYKAGAISQYEYDEFLKAVAAKRKNAEDIKYELDSIMHSNDLGLAIQNEKASAMESEIRQMKEKLNKNYISGSNIVCTMDNGIVCELGYKAGDEVSSEKKILSLMNMDTLVVKADVAEEFIKDVKLDAKAEIIPVADKSSQYDGKVTNIARKAVVQNGETVVPVEISIDNRDGFMLPNFNVDVKIYMD